MLEANKKHGVEWEKKGRTRNPESLAAGGARKAIFWLALGLKQMIFDSSGFSAKDDLNTCACVISVRGWDDRGVISLRGLDEKGVISLNGWWERRYLIERWDERGVFYWGDGMREALSHSEGMGWGRRYLTEGMGWKRRYLTERMV